MNTLRLAMAALRNFLIGSAVIAFLFIFLCMPSADLVEVIRAVAWPLAAVAIVLLFAVHPRLNRIFGMTRAIRKLKAAGVEMEINAEVVDQVRSQLNESFDKLVRNAKDEYDQMSRAMRIPAHLQSIMTKCVTRELRCREFPTSPAGLRGTIHVQDIVFSEYLYQLTEYYPKRGGAGRRFSIRYGVIGRS